MKEYIALSHARTAVKKKAWEEWRASAAEDLCLAAEQWSLAETFSSQCRQGECFVLNPNL